MPSLRDFEFQLNRYATDILSLRDASCKDFKHAISDLKLPIFCTPAKYKKVILS